MNITYTAVLGRPRHLSGMAGKTQRFVFATCLLLAVSLSKVGSQLPTWAVNPLRPDPYYSTTLKVGQTNFAEVLRSLTEALHETQRSRGDSSLAATQCEKDFQAMLQDKDAQNISKGERALDAFGKPGPYILEGNLRLTGSFDECLDIAGELTKFCILPLVPGEISADGGFESFNLTFLADICVPRSCNTTDFEKYVAAANAYLAGKNVTYRVHYASDSTICEDTKRIPYSGGAIAMIVVCAIFALLAIIGTAVDFGVKTIRDLSKKPELAKIFKRTPPAYNSDGEGSPLLGGAPKKEEDDIFASFEKPLEFVTAFSIIKNVNTIFSTKMPPTAITSLNGIRVLSMGWVILAHTFLWVLQTHSFKAPLYTVEHATHRFSFQAMSNGFFAVDSFFFLSGALVSYLTLREMERKKGRFPVITYYLHRYLRLTMVYAFLLFFWWTLTVHLGNGPTWRKAAGVDSDLQNNCEKYWWTNFLYINNLYPWGLKDECMGWTWYLSNDMQFYILAPLIVIPLYFFFPAGLLISGVLIIVTIVANGAIAGVKGFQANMFQDHSGGENNDIYIKPYTRAGPYIVGLVLGYILFKKVRINIHWLADWLIYRVVLTVAGGCLFSTLYGLYSSWGRGGISLAENVSYFMFSRFVWAFGLALLVFACHNGYGRAINAFLSMGFWVPLSRLTYTAYLFHPIILTVVFNTLREPFTYSDYILTVYGIAMVVLSFGAAGVVAVFVEFPLSNLEMAVFKAAGLKLRESTRNVESQKKGVRLEARNSKPTSPINEGSKA
jgi:peptidoglycan/LPS O-acetylase OafA/YrhL